MADPQEAPVAPTAPVEQPVAPVDQPVAPVDPPVVPRPSPVVAPIELQLDPTELPADNGVPLGQWVAAGGVTLALALVAGMAVRRLISPPAIGMGAPARAPVVDTRPTTSPTAEAPVARVEPTGLARFTAALSRTASGFRDLFGRPIDESLIEELEDALLIADVGMETTTRLLDSVRAAWKGGETGPDALREVLRSEMTGILTSVHAPMEPVGKPWVMLVVGVNGSGKTTTIGKLAARFKGQGKRVMLAASDTYRAAAAEQLQVWAERAEVDLVRHDEGADPGAVAYDALQSALAKGHDVVIIDTAGRLQTRKPLMDQLTKIRRVIAKVVPDGPHETLLVIDGTMGQNALSQARLFHEATPLTAVAVTKLDGTAKGGVVLAVAAELSLPVKLVGVGEKIEDLRDFDPALFVDAIAG